MSWAIKAVEKAALELARQELTQNPNGLLVMGMNTGVLAALSSFVFETLGQSPGTFEPDELLRRLRERRK